METWWQKGSKIEVSLPPEEAIEVCKEEIKVLKQQIFIKRHQHPAYNQLKENLKAGELWLHVDYSENYVNKQQNEIQSAYFGHDCFSVFTACSHLCDAGGKLINENVTVISEASDHSRIAAFSCINTVFQFVCEKDNLPLKVILHILDLLPSAGSIMSAIMEKVPSMVSEVRSKQSLLRRDVWKM